MDYKDTLLMPKGAFPMRANLSIKEVEIQKYWQDIHLYQKNLIKNKKGPAFILHDGPPYANGAIHIGHAFQKTLKDFVLRYKTLSGYYVPYTPGWDTHGLPIEHEVTKKIDRKTTPVLEFRQACQAWAISQVEKQKTNFQRLGIIGNWDQPYLTLDKSFEANQLYIFSQMVKKNLIYQGLKPVYWSPSSESALAEAEIEYQDVESYSLYVAFKIFDPKNISSLKDAYLLIWTTTPWTLVANQAVSVNPHFTYLLIQSQGKKYVILEDLQPKLVEELNWKNTQVLATFKGSELEFLTYEHPLFKNPLPIINGEHVSNTEGSGLVHTAPGHGDDDYQVGLKYNLRVFCPVDGKGIYTKEARQYQGLFYEKANEIIINDLIKADLLVKQSKFTHSYPHDWRTKKPVIYRATPQWFCSINGLKEQLLKNIEEIKWYPAWGQIRMQNMIKDRSDWCISRQRVWGVPLPIFYAEDGSPILDEQIILHISKKFKKYGSDCWFSKTPKQLLPKGYTHPASPHGKFTKETDIMDVWFDSGTSYMVVKNQGFFPANLYLEGADQFRGWFNSSLITATSVYGISPYRELVTHGFVLDGAGRKMSKSLGNVINPLDVINKYGADVLRLWVSTTEYSVDVRISNDILDQVAEIYRKIRNTLKYLLGAINDFQVDKSFIAYSMQNSVNRYILERLDLVYTQCLNAYENYNFSDVLKILMPFISNELSAFYLDYAKDILYIENQFNFERVALQSVLYKVTYTLLLLLNPLIPHTTSEAFKEFPDKIEEDIYLCRYFKVSSNPNLELIDKMSIFFNLRSQVLKGLEEARLAKIIGKSNEAQVVINLPKASIEVIKQLDLNLQQLLIVAKVEIIEDEKLHITITKAAGVVCDRCWNTVEKVNENGLCSRCQNILFSAKEGQK